MRYETSFRIGEREISATAPTYFIADVASSHDGDLGRAKDLIWLCKEAGADCVKFQHFLAKDIVSGPGFRDLGGQIAHQAAWEKPVYEIYEQYQTPRVWTETLVETAKAADIEFMTTPYDYEAVEIFDPLLSAYKIGSGDITWTDFIRYVAGKAKPLFLATGAATMTDVERAVDAALEVNPALCLMQCNTNYTGELENFRYVNLNVLRAFALHYPGLPLGLSDHTPGCAAVLGAVALGARAVEKHFTDDNSREGPDHAFSMNPQSWAEMVARTRELEYALGDGVKRVEGNEQESAVVQQRALRLKRSVPAGERLSPSDLEALRPAPEGALKPYEIDDALRAPLRAAKQTGDALFPGDFEAAE
ncbi:MAG: N-acetylneuraminate synthase family protein [Pseudomonadota bacterium]